jgi:hypothetical protein
VRAAARRHCGAGEVQAALWMVPVGLPGTEQLPLPGRAPAAAGGEDRNLPRARSFTTREPGARHSQRASAATNEGQTTWLQVPKGQNLLCRHA